MIELAVAIPILALVLLGTADFGRVFYDAIAIQNAARAGVQYGAGKGPSFTDLAGMENAALNDIPGFTSATAQASQFCTCGYGERTACTTSCSAKRMYIEVIVRQPFNLVAPYPGLPGQTQLTATALLRVK